jgi:nitrogen regulatory protein PII-like uncharacterized protein
MADPSPIWDFLNQEFTKAFVGSLAGAGAGAWAAQYIVEKSRVREELLKEIRNTNAAITLVFGVANTFLNVKMQHVQAMYENFNKDREAALEAKKKFTPGDKKQFRFTADIRFQNPPKVPLPQLQKLVFENIDAPTRAISLIESLDRSVDTLNSFLLMRNGLIEEFKHTGLNPDAYFGFKVGDMIDERYASTIKAIYDSTDECIYFSKLLSEDLTRHGNKLKARVPRRFFGTTPNIVTADFSKAQAYIPSASKFPTWQTAFVAPDPPFTLNFWRTIPPEDSC